MRIALIAALLLFVYAEVKSQSAQAVFDEANTYFENGDPAQAMNLYKMIEESGSVSGALFLNMGISAVQMDSLGLAKFYFLKASEFEVTQQDANRALEYVNSQFSRQSAKLPKLPWDCAVELLIKEFGAFSVFMVGFLLFCAGLLLLSLHWFKIFSPKKVLWYLNSLIISGIFVISLSFYVDYVDRRYQEGVMVADSGRVLQSPQNESNLISIAYEGYDLIVDSRKSDEYENWLYIRLGNGQYGWIKNEGVKVF